MREILFRGKATDNGEWFIGDIFHSSMDVDTVRIHDYINRANVTIIPETVGQYTGLTDKNGQKIFEGDIVSFNYDTSSVKMTDGCWGLDDGCTLLYDLEELEVIGNVHDNPELIGGEPE